MLQIPWIRALGVGCLQSEVARATLIELGTSLGLVTNLTATRYSSFNLLYTYFSPTNAMMTLERGGKS
jgi:hypothetical protein